MNQKEFSKNRENAKKFAKMFVDFCYRKFDYGTPRDNRQERVIWGVFNEVLDNKKIEIDSNNTI